MHVIEINRPDRAARRRRGKTDALDAARAVLSGRATAQAKAGDGHVEAIRMFKIAKDSANKARTQAINQLRAVLVRAEPQLRESLRGLGPVTLFRACANLPTTDTTTTGAATVMVLRGLARRILTLTDEVKVLNGQIRAALKVCAPKLLERHGVGPDTAAALLITAGDNPQRLTSAAAFAALCGVNPVEAFPPANHPTPTQPRRRPASQQRPLHHRLDPPRPRPPHPRVRQPPHHTREIHQEIIRCLKRYVARELFPIITAALTPATTPPPTT